MNLVMVAAFDEMLNQDEIPEESPTRAPDPVVETNREFVGGLAGLGLPIPPGAPRS